jgi:hypothetical protein
MLSDAFVPIAFFLGLWLASLCKSRALIGCIYPAGGLLRAAALSEHGCADEGQVTGHALHCDSRPRKRRQAQGTLAAVDTIVRDVRSLEGLSTNESFIHDVVYYTYP